MEVVEVLGRKLVAVEGPDPAVRPREQEEHAHKTCAIDSLFVPPRQICEPVLELHIALFDVAWLRPCRWDVEGGCLQVRLR